MEYVRDGLRARKAWFFLDHAVVCLGAGIDGDAPETILTSVNQCALNGRVTIRGNVAQPSPAGITPEGGGATWELLKGQRSTGALEWVHHDGMGYVFLEPTMATVCAQTQSGDWRRVHSRESARTVDQDVFSLWLDHGRQPRGGRYAYIVVPNVSVAALPSWRESASIAILQQTASVQAIASRDGKLVQAAFFEPGRLTWGEGASIEAQSPCLVMLDETASSVRLHVTDPTHTCKTLTLRLAGRYIGREARYDTDRGQTELTVDLPQEGFAGQTVRLDLQRGRRIGR
jgi:chondroitin AC lyase